MRNVDYRPLATSQAGQPRGGLPLPQQNLDRRGCAPVPALNLDYDRNSFHAISVSK